jgi:hypothetical protein
VERPIIEYAFRYDDLEDNDAPSPTTIRPMYQNIDFVTHDRQIPPRSEARSRQKRWSQRLRNSNSFPSVGPFSPSFSHLTFNRPRTAPSEMSDEQLDEWLERPEDADLHRERKFSASSMSSTTYSSERDWSPGGGSRIEEENEEHLSPLDMAWPSPPSSMGWYPGDEVEDEDEIEDEDDLCGSVESITPLAMIPSQSSVFTTPRLSPSLDTIPDEVLLEVARHLDMKSVALLRMGCTKLYDTIPAPLRPLAMKKG